MHAKVLIIDDEVGFTQILRMNLERLSRYEVRVINDSRAAWEAACQFEPDVILLDAVMPGLDGAELVAKFEEDPALCRVPVIMLSGLMHPDDDPHAVTKTESTRILQKPINMDLLTKCMDNAIRGL